MIALLLALALPVIRPQPSLTPGQVRPITKAEVCATAWGADRRHVTPAMKRHVAAAYGIPWSQRGRYEFDHLVPRELGGADTEANLWPQAWMGPWNAHQKDRLENVLRRAVCAGTIGIREAQEAIRLDWITAYRQYVGQ